MSPVEIETTSLMTLVGIIILIGFSIWEAIAGTIKENRSKAKKS